MHTVSEGNQTWKAVLILMFVYWSNIIVRIKIGVLVRRR
jgi:hypothetical protein